MNQQKILLNNLLIFFFAFLFSVVVAPKLEASTTSNVTTTVQVSICGNHQRDGGEECDNENLVEKTCTQLGYAGGNLSCDISCSFETSACLVPTLTPHAISHTNVSSLLAAGYFTIPHTASILSSPSLTTTEQITITIPDSGGTSSILLPDNLVITRSDGGTINPMVLTAADIPYTSVSGFPSNTIIDGVIQWGLPNTTLVFSSPISVSLAVGQALNGETLSIVRSDTPTSGWTSDGIVAPPTCSVQEGLCRFQATKASYFATLRAGVSTVTNATNTSTASNTPASILTATPTQQAFAQSKAIITPKTSTIRTLPDLVQLFDLDKNGNIEVTEVSQAIKLWVAAREDLQDNNCDINKDKACDVQDISILLFYVEQ